VRWRGEIGDSGASVRIWAICVETRGGTIADLGMLC